ncbi:MAG TPA: right-handed parallel beta-helix repeat-containing protein [bacterium]|nr:right-handed parallel beta-helix repeat-containing protein [bacterium]
MNIRLFAFLLLGTILCTPLFVQAARQSDPATGIVYYVSPAGNDAWSGKLPVPASSGQDGPFATIQAARDAVRSLKSGKDLTQQVTVFLRDGVYRIDKPVEFSSEDSGTDNLPILYAAYPGENPVISGGRPIQRWSVENKDGKVTWYVDIPEVKSGAWWFRELFVNGKRLPRTRLPKSGYYQFTDLVDLLERPTWGDGVWAAMFNPGEIKYWKNLQDVDIVALTRWIESRSPIAGIDGAKNIVTFKKKSTFRLENTRAGEKYARYYVENVFEEMDGPGEWYLDRPAGRLYYIPSDGQTPENTVVEAPVLTRLVTLQASNIQFKGITFRHAEWEFPADRAGSVQAAHEVPGALYMEGVENCLLSQCTIEQCGTYGIEIGKNCRDIVIRHCSIRNMGAGGIKVGHDSTATTIADNVVSECGRIYHSAIGIWVGNSGHNSIIHNHVYDLFYTGISVGWSWGYGDTQTQDNEIAYNHIHDIGQDVLCDMGAIYTLGVADGSRIHHNLIHDVRCHGFGGWGIYLDEGTTYMTVENNLVYRAETGGFHIHYGKENLVQNNVFALATTNQIQRSRNEDHIGIHFVGNIVYFTEGTLLGGTWKNNQFRLDNNLYWNPNEKEIAFPDADYETWKAQGHDKKSRIADPRFVDPGNDDFRLKSNSPAIRMGFRRIDLTKVGPRPLE